MGSIDTRLHELEARVAALEAEMQGHERWLEGLEAERAALERPHIHHARELQFGTDEPSYLEQAARPAPQQPDSAELASWYDSFDARITAVAATCSTLAIKVQHLENGLCGSESGCDLWTAPQQPHSCLLCGHPTDHLPDCPTQRWQPRGGGG